MKTIIGNLLDTEAGVITAQQMHERIEEARYAMVAGNLDNKPVPPDVIGRWLDYIEEYMLPDATRVNEA